MSSSPDRKEDIMDLHELEERDFGRGPILWDADPDVCCAVFQLGACSHSEAMYEHQPEDDEIYDAYLEGRS